MSGEERKIGRASGWTVEKEPDGRFRWTAYGPDGAEQGYARTREEAERAGRRAEQELLRSGNPPEGRR